MPDREKIKKELLELNAEAYRSWVHDQKNVFLIQIGNVTSDALELLKEQEAVPVIQREIAHLLFWCCGSCGVAITDGDKFCRNCGREVKWN